MNGQNILKDEIPEISNALLYEGCKIQILIVLHVKGWESDSEENMPH